MQPVIIVNKIDLLSSAPTEVDPSIIEIEKILYQEFLQVYLALGYKVIPVSVITGEGIEEVKAAMRGKTSVFSGQSGVGKSSLINALTGSTLTTGSIVQRTRKGSHTTTTTLLIPLDEGGFCIDTPGIKSFGLWNINASDIAAYYPEIFALSASCKYPDCAHLNEPECAVKNAALEHRISSLRFASYCALMSSVAQIHKQR
jgi:ribosome biogenesis GTPase